jgi:hypothetical protein
MYRISKTDNHINDMYMGTENPIFNAVYYPPSNYYKATWCQNSPIIF